MTITEFLLARIAEDEAWVTERYAGVTIGIVPDDQRIVPFPGSIDRTMAECEAKRRVIEYSWGDRLSIEGEWGSGRSREEMDAKDDVPDAVRALAAIYADHPDYREEWRA